MKGKKKPEEILAEKHRSSRSNTAVSKANSDSELALQKELERLRVLLGISDELSLKWIPGHVKHDVMSGKKISGEVAGNVILIYDEGLDGAMKTLRHEVIDYAITKSIVEPLVSLVNLLVKDRELEIYKQKERLVDKLSNLLR